MKKQHEPAYGPKIRQKWYFLVEKVGKSVKKVCGSYAISRKTYYKWSGIDRGSRRHVPSQKQPKLKLANEIRGFIETQKIRLNCGPKKWSEGLMPGFLIWGSRRAELDRAREIFSDAVLGGHEYNSFLPAVERYFMQFALLASRSRA